ncbi:MAG: MMPL family transporter [archaeon]
MVDWKPMLSNKKVIFACLCFLLIGILPIQLKGLQFGLDFQGGTLIDVKLNEKLEQKEMQSVINVIQTRLNAYGLKDVSVKPSYGQYITIEIAETNPESISKIQSLLAQQGKFEILFDGKVVLQGEDIVSVITDPQKGSGVHPGGTEWVVPFLVTPDAAQRFANEVKGKCTLTSEQVCEEKVFMFLDRPENATIVIPEKMYQDENQVPIDFDKSLIKISIDELVKQAGINLLVSNTLPENISLIHGKIIVPSGAYNISKEFAGKVIEKEKYGKYWIVSALNLQSIVSLTPGVTAGNPIENPSITGHAESMEKSLEEYNKIVILLKSGKLPVSVTVSDVISISPTLGASFLKWTAIIGFLAIGFVASVLFVRYKKPLIVFPIMLTCIFEVTIVLGLAALINWQLDLPSMAGIIAAVGTGVNDQIIITDELLRGERRRIEESTVQKIKRAFSIIFMSAGTIIFAMLPLLFAGLGSLKGFAITTILGVLVGLFITRPAYAEIVEKLV